MKFPLLPVISLLVAGAILSTTTKNPTPTLPLIITCESISIKDKAKTDQWLIAQAREYIEKIPDLESFSYIDFVGKTLQKLNKDCFTKFNSQSLSDNGKILATLLRDKLQKAFVTAYFGNVATLSDEDKITYNQFNEVINPEKLVEFSKMLEWTNELDKQLPDALIAIDKYNKWPLQ